MIELAVSFSVGFLVDFLSGNPSKAPSGPQGVQFLRHRDVFNFVDDIGVGVANIGPVA